MYVVPLYMKSQFLWTTPHIWRCFFVVQQGQVASMTLHLRELLSGAMSIYLAQCCCSCGVAV